MGVHAKWASPEEVRAAQQANGLGLSGSGRAGLGHALTLAAIAQKPPGRYVFVKTVGRGDKARCVHREWGQRGGGQ